MKTKKKNALFGRYPSCDMLNNALRFIRNGKIDLSDILTVVGKNTTGQKVGEVM